MDRRYDYEKLVNTVKKENNFFKRSYYHSIIDSNPAKLDSILKNGILCKSSLIYYQLPSMFTHEGDDCDSKNGFSHISLCEYKDDCSFNMLFSAFTMHTLTSISLMVKKSIKVTKEGVRESFFDDEVFSSKAIDKSCIKGIILPEQLSKTKLKKVSFLTSDLTNYTWKYLLNWVNCMQSYFQINIPNSYIERLSISHDQFVDICKEYEAPSRWVAGVLKTQRQRYGSDLKDIIAEIVNYLCISMYGLDNPEYIEIVKLINVENIPIYEIGQRSLKRIN